MRVNTSSLLTALLGFCAGSAIFPLTKPDNITVYAGTFTNTDLQSILFRGETDYRDSYITVLTLDWELEPRSNWFVMGAEGQVVKHFGLMRHLEVNGAMIVRSDPERFPLQVALGEGLSFATQNPSLENPKKDMLGLQYRERSRNLLNYLMFEGAFRLDALPKWLDPFPKGSDLFIRIHHRSGAFGTYCPPTCGSNFVAYGIRLRI